MTRVLLAALLLVPTVLSSGAVATTADEPNVTCRIDAVAEGAAEGGVVAAEVDCLQLAPEVHGEFDLRVTVTLQVHRPAGWQDVDTRTCGGRSQDGVRTTTCAVLGDTGGGDVRGLVDLQSPLDWAPAVADPRYSGGNPRQDPLAIDECGVDEVVGDTDQTAPDAPWADLCGVFAASALDEEGALDHLALTSQVTGFVDDRAGGTRWRVAFATDAEGDCAHEVEVADDGDRDVSATITTRCGPSSLPCGPVLTLLSELTGGGCSGGTVYEELRTTSLPADAVALGGDEVTVALRAADLPEDLLVAFAPGAVIERVSATTVSVADTPAGVVAYDVDTARSTGATHTIGG